jgi:hypothetical protein
MAERYMVVYYHQQPNGKFLELTEFKDNLKSKTKAKASVVLYFKKRRVIKNSINPDADFISILEMYKKLLGDQLTPYLN